VFHLSSTKKSNYSYQFPLTNLNLEQHKAGAVELLSDSLTCILTGGNLPIMIVSRGFKIIAKRAIKNKKGNRYAKKHKRDKRKRSRKKKNPTIGK
jgi:hypothetical protein